MEHQVERRRDQGERRRVLGVGRGVSSAEERRLDSVRCSAGLDSGHGGTRRGGAARSIPRLTAQVVTRASVDAYSLCRRQDHRPAALPGAVALPGPANATQRPRPSRHRVGGTVRSARRASTSSSPVSTGHELGCRDPLLPRPPCTPAIHSAPTPATYGDDVAAPPLDLLDWLRPQCAQFVFLPAGVYAERGKNDWPLVAQEPPDLTAKLDEGRHLSPLSKESAALASVIEVALVDFLPERLDRTPGATGRRGEERTLPRPRDRW